MFGPTPIEAAPQGAEEDARVSLIRNHHMSWSRSPRLSVGLAAIVAMTALSSLGAGSAAAAEPDPVLLVHGYRGDPSTWSG